MKVGKKTCKELKKIAGGLLVLMILFWVIIRWQVRTSEREEIAKTWKIEADTLIFFVHDDVPEDTVEMDRYIVLRFKDRDAVYKRIEVNTR